jgi:lipid-A-disaccharide synthase
VNWVMGEIRVNELLQEAVTPENVASTLEELLTDEGERARLKTVYGEIRERLGAGGASARAAAAVFELLEK